MKREDSSPIGGLKPVSEAASTLPYFQILLAQGCRILKFGHGPTEAGKDIIAVGPDGDLERIR